MCIKRAVTVSILFCLLTFFLIFPAPEVQALSISDYFVYTYDFTFSKTTITGSETFFVMVTGEATCIKDLPLSLNATEAYVESKIVATLAGSEVVLNQNYTISYPDFPSKKGETASASIQVPLSFPSSCVSGVYNVTGYLNVARVKVEFIWISVREFLPSSQPMGSVTYQSVTGGGVGSTESNPATNLVQFMDENGMFLEDTQVQSVDKTMKLIFPQGTRFTIPGGIGSTVIIKQVEKGAEPEAPRNYQIIGQAYEIEPDEANFSPPITMIFSYDENILPPGAQEIDMLIAWWDTEGNKWVPLEDCEVDEVANTVTGFVEHFTVFAKIIDMSPPASFNILSLIINPVQAETTKSVTVTVEVENVGGRTGTCILVLKINGIEETRENIILDSGASENIDFIVARDVPDTYYIDVNGLTGSFSVASPSEVEQITSVAESSSSSGINPIPGSQPEPQPEPSTDKDEKPVQLLSEREPFAWWQIPMALVGGMLIGGFILLLFWHSRKASRR